MLNVSQAELGTLEASLLNLSGNVPLHNRFRALFTLKALKSEEAVRIISKGEDYLSEPEAGPLINIHAGFQDPSALLKHELAYCLGQMKDTAALPILESVLANGQEDPMVRHEVGRFSSHRRIHAASRVYMRRRRRQWVLYLRPHLYPYSKNI
jgi:deoxyhypusine monooxygenase